MILNTDVVLCNYCNDVSMEYYGILKKFLQHLAHIGKTNEDFSLKLVPVKRTAASARIPSTLTLEQIEKILSSVDRDSPQGKRDYAVLLLAVKLGIRTCDIRNLRPSNIDWEQHMISFVQIKTGEPLSLPLPVDVGWAIIDYLKNGRPVSDAPEIFLRAVAPYESLQNFDNILIKHIPTTNLATKGESITFFTPTIEGTIMRRNKVDGRNKHPWKAEVTDGDTKVSAEIITNWYKSVYEPEYSA